MISDTHGLHGSLQIPECDILLHSGDFTNSGDFFEARDFQQWFAAQRATHKVLIAGNHDGDWVEKNLKEFESSCRHHGITFLHNSGTVIEDLKIWGSPNTPTFFDWAYMLPEDELTEIWDLIPRDTDILMTHGPAFGTLDTTARNGCAGSQTLHVAVETIEPLIHLCGHIHEARGIRHNPETGRMSVNATVVMSTRGHSITGIHPEPFVVTLERKDGGKWSIST